MEKRRVLVIDDDPIIRDRLEQEIKRSFFDTFSAGDGKTALEIFNNNVIDIALIDVNLPDMKGFELLDHFKLERPECEVIMITGFGTQDVAITALRKGAIDYIEKPIDVDSLSASIGRAQEKIRHSGTIEYKNVILVIDDEEEITNRLGRFLQKEGYEIFKASSGKEGLDIITANKIDIVITDINMKGMDGIEVTTKAKKLYPDIESIVITGFKDTSLAVAALRAGTSGYLTKPVNLDELIIEVEKAIERINLYRNKLYRNRELKISSEIILKMNEELERRVEQRSQELSQTQSALFQTSKLATLGEMSAGLAHEINQPLGGIALITTTLKKLHERDMLTPEELLSGLGDIDQSVKRMTKIITHIRTFARQEALKFVDVDLNETIDSALSLLGEQLRLHQIEYELHLGEGGVNVAGEPYQLEQVWINMISNARDSLDEKKLKVMDGTLPKETFNKKLIITTRYSEDLSIAEIVFEDNGMGISPENIEKILEPFFTTKEVGKSTGLGLSISYGIIDSHKGKINIKSEVNKSATVTISLPVMGTGEKDV